MIVLGIAAAAHATAIFGPELLRSRPEKPKITQHVMHEEIRTQGAPKPDVKLLKEERKRYLAELLSSLKNGEKIKLSDFLIRSHVLDKNIELAEKGVFGPDENIFRSRYRQLVKRAKKEVIDRENKIKAIHRFLHTEVFVGYYWKSGSILDVLEKGWYNCCSSTEIFSALLEDVLKQEKYGVLLFNDHLASFVNGKVLENTDHSWKTAYKKYNKCGLIAPREIFIAAYLLKHSIPKQELPPHILALYTKRVWKGCSKKKKELISESLGKSGFPDPRVNSGLSAPVSFLPNPNFELKAEKITELAEGLVVAYQMSHLYEERRFLNAKLDGHRLKVKPIPIPENVDWGEVLERFGWSSSRSYIFSFLPEKLNCCLPVRSISPETIPDIVEMLSVDGRMDFEGYRKENLCSVYGEVIKRGQLEELRKFLPYSFCEELSEPLKKRYQEEKDEDILWVGLGNMRLPQNFDFFLEELKSEDRRIRHSAGLALILSDTKKACEVLKALPENEKKNQSVALTWCCKDLETAWKWIYKFESTREADDYHVVENALQIIKGNEMNRHQHETLKRIADDVHSSARFDLARIFYEYGDDKTAERYVKEVVEEAMGGGVGTFYLCNFPKESTHLVAPLLTKRPEYTMSIANTMLFYEEHRKYLPEIKKSLREVVFDDEMALYERVEAAFLLLRLGVDPSEIRSYSFNR